MVTVVPRPTLAFVPDGSVLQLDEAPHKRQPDPGAFDAAPVCPSARRTSPRAASGRLGDADAGIANRDVAQRLIVVHGDGD